MPEAPVVHVIDDDDAVRDSISFLLSASGVATRVFESAEDFLAALPGIAPGCVVTDVRMPRMSGLDLIRALRARGVNQPVIVITGHGDVPLAVRAMRAGAVDFLEKPFREEALIEGIRRAFASRKSQPSDGEIEAVKQRVSSLTGREREILDLIVEGSTSKEVARVLSISPRTVDIHRGHVMEKMRAGNIADLIRMVLSTK